ncbi:hypothetical protein T02_13421 [Trichinella nativa]|uniref:Uncharacterized protein n=1 Tax=Trichinella nativa TaxID=6335 RepID=A0A0V1LD54_9BILA|nr:hypothetical protein T02_13421 [Trichinella nativa]
MADVPELHLVQNRCGGMSLNKKGMGGAIWTNLDVTSVIEQNESCPVDEHLVYKMEKKALLKKWSAEETKPILAIYNEEASAASAEPSTFGHFPLFKRVKSMMYSNRTKRYPELPKHRRDKISSKHLTINLNLIDIKMKHF